MRQNAAWASPGCRSHVHEALRDGRLQRLLPEWEIAQLPMYLVHPQRRHPTRLQTTFRAFALVWFDAPERQALLR